MCELYVSSPDSKAVKFLIFWGEKVNNFNVPLSVEV